MKILKKIAFTCLIFFNFCGMHGMQVKQFNVAHSNIQSPMHAKIKLPVALEDGTQSHTEMPPAVQIIERTDDPFGVENTCPEKCFGACVVCTLTSAVACCFR